MPRQRPFRSDVSLVNAYNFQEIIRNIVKGSALNVQIRRDAQCFTRPRLGRGVIRLAVGEKNSINPFVLRRLSGKKVL
jgi:hypothetical protein